MRIETCLNCSQELIEKKNYNIFIGISLGNKYFSKENIEKYIKWALDNTKTNVAILIADTIHAINHEVFDKCTKERALKVAMRKSKQIEDNVREIIESLSTNKQSLVRIIKWDEYRETDIYKNLFPVIMDEFCNNELFHEHIINIVKQNLKGRVDNFSKERLDKLALYILDELPSLLNGIEYEGIGYELHPYPGLSLLDELWMGIRSSSLFPELASKLKYKENIAQVEGYVD